VLPTPRKVKLAVGAAEGGSRLTAFDKALLAAGIGNLNLVRVSSILPPGCVPEDDFSVPPGSLTPTAYGSLTCDEPGRQIAAAIALGWGGDDFGVIMEFSGFCGRAEAEERVAVMVHEAFSARGRPVGRLEVRAVVHTVQRLGAVVAAAVLWY
jgi:arginine decarboxylase